MELESYIRHIPGFPKEGILFHDIMPMLQHPEALHYAVDQLAEFARGRQADLILGAEARGFILGAAMAYSLNIGFATARKPGKLPYTVKRCEYDLEYGTDVLEMHTDAIQPGQRVVIHDDLLATGGTAAAKVRLVEECRWCRRRTRVPHRVDRPRREGPPPGLRGLQHAPVSVLIARR